MSLKLFTQVRHLVDGFFKLIGSLYSAVVSNVQGEWYNLKRLSFKRHIIIKNNLDLGKYHLQEGNISDALLRFYLVSKLLDKGNKEAVYNMGLCYLLQAKYDQAKLCFVEAAEFDKIGLANFLENYKTVQIIPSRIETLYRDLVNKKYIDRFQLEKSNLYVELIKELNSHLSILPDKCAVLELGFNIGLLGHEIKKRLPDEFVITGVESSSVMIALHNKISGVSKYDYIVEQSVFDYLNNSKGKYDIVLSVGGLAGTSNLSNVLPAIKNLLNNNGILAFVVQTAIVSDFDQENFSFVLNESEANQSLLNNGFKILYTKQIKLVKNKIFSIFIVKT